MDGTSGCELELDDRLVLAVAVVAERLGIESKYVECSGVTGEFSTDVSGVVWADVKKLFPMNENSAESPDRSEDVDDAELRGLISGAVSARTFVVDRSSVGKEISSRLMVPGAYRTLPARSGRGATSGRLTFFVKARARDIVSYSVV